MKKIGFTLIEILVVVGILGTVMIISGVVLTNTLRTGNRVVSSDEVETSGTYILGAMKQLILSSKPETLTELGSCSSSRLELVNRFDDSQIILECINGKISSNSAQLHPDSIQVLNDCANFLSCDTSGEFPVINIGFTLSKGEATDITKNFKRSFESRVVMR
jgi:type II secretory pathway pseudopilin PulG